MSTRAGSVDIKELRKKGRNDEEDSIVCDERLQKIRPVGQKVEV